MKFHRHDTPMHLAWDEYKLKPYYAHAANQAGLDINDPEDEGTLWWAFSKGYEAALDGKCSKSLNKD